MKKISKQQLIIIGGIFVEIILAFLLPHLLVQIKLEGGKNFVLNYGDEYIEPRYYATLFQKDITEDIKVSGKVKDDLGNYYITYSYKFLFYNVKVQRTVKVKDIKGPRISLTKGEICEIAVGDTYEEPGFIAVDNIDGVVTNTVKVSGSVNTSEFGDYEVTDSNNNNYTKVIRTVKVGRKKTTQMTVQAYSLDGWYDDVKLKETENQGEIYFNKIAIVGNITNFYLNKLLAARNAWTLPNLTVSSLLNDTIDIHGYFIQTSLLDGITMVKPEIMLLNFGSFSTTKMTEEKIVENANSIIEKIKENNPEMKLILSSIYPIKQGTNANNFTQEKINYYNYLILQTASKHNIKFLDVASVLKDNTGYGNPQYFSADNFHLSYLGHTKVKEYIVTHAYIETQE